MTHILDTAYETRPAITIFTALDSEEYLDLFHFDEEKDGCKADPKGLKRDVEVSDCVSQELMGSLPDWLRSDCNATYDLKKHLSHEVHSGYIDIMPTMASFNSILKNGSCRTRYPE